MIKIIAINKFNNTSLQKALKINKELIDASLKDKGCLCFNMYKDINDETRITTIEEWDSLVDLNLHSNSEHVKKLLPQLQKIAEAEPIVTVIEQIY